MNIKRNIIFALESRKKNGVPVIENVPIRMRVIFASHRIEFTTGYRIDAAKWDADKQRVKNGCTNKLKQSASDINTDLLRYYTIMQEVPQLVADNEYWINPHIGDYDLQTHYDNIKQMVKSKTGRAMQEKERERKTKSGKIVKVAGCSPIREGVLLIKSETTLEDVRRFGEECQERWGITPLQIFLHKGEGHWLGGEPAPDDKESFQIGGRWFKPNYHAHIVFDWMNHDTGKSRKLNDDDMMQMQIWHPKSYQCSEDNPNPRRARSIWNETTLSSRSSVQSLNALRLSDSTRNTR